MTRIKAAINHCRERTANQMKVFLSWSGTESRALAGILHEWLPTVLEFVDPWMSSEDITKGRRWGAEIERALERTSYCIVCVTPGVQHEPWVNFEAGAVSKIVEGSYVSPLLLGISIRDLSGHPLSMFQCTHFRQEEVLKLLQSINSASESAIPTNRLKRILVYTWPALREKVAAIDLVGVSRQVDGNEEQEADYELLDDLEEQILILIACSNAHRLNVAYMAYQIGKNAVRTQYHVDVLLERGLIRGDFFSDPTAYRLTREGRAYLVENELID